MQFNELSLSEHIHENTPIAQETKHRQHLGRCQTFSHCVSSPPKITALCTDESIYSLVMCLLSLQVILVKFKLC